MRQELQDDSTQLSILWFEAFFWVCFTGATSVVLVEVGAMVIILGISNSSALVAIFAFVPSAVSLNKGRVDVLPKSGLLSSAGRAQDF